MPPPASTTTPDAAARGSDDGAEELELDRPSGASSGEVDDMETAAAGIDEPARQRRRVGSGRNPAIVVALHEADGASLEQVDGTDDLHHATAAGVASSRPSAKAVSSARPTGPLFSG
jgi:hypothetical protein